MNRKLTLFLVLLHIAATGLSASGVFAMASVSPNGQGAQGVVQHHDASPMHGSDTSASDHQAAGSAGHCGEDQGAGCCYLCFTLYTSDAPVVYVIPGRDLHSVDFHGATPENVAMSIFHPPKR